MRWDWDPNDQPISYLLIDWKIDEWDTDILHKFQRHSQAITYRFDYISGIGTAVYFDGNIITIIKSYGIAPFKDFMLHRASLHRTMIGVHTIRCDWIVCLGVKPKVSDTVLLIPAVHGCEPSQSDRQTPPFGLCRKAGGQWQTKLVRLILTQFTKAQNRDTLIRASHDPSDICRPVSKELTGILLEFSTILRIPQDLIVQLPGLSPVCAMHVQCFYENCIVFRRRNSFRLCAELRDDVV